MLCVGVGGTEWRGTERAGGAEESSATVLLTAFATGSTGGWRGVQRLWEASQARFLKSLDLWPRDVFSSAMWLAAVLMQQALLSSSQRLGFSIVIFQSRGECQLDCYTQISGNV